MRCHLLCGCAKPSVDNDVGRRGPSGQYKAPIRGCRRGAVDQSQRILDRVAVETRDEINVVGPMIERIDGVECRRFCEVGVRHEPDDGGPRAGRQRTGQHIGAAAIKQRQL